jgi:hypothetical protein
MPVYLYCVMRGIRQPRGEKNEKHACKKFHSFIHGSALAAELAFRLMCLMYFWSLCDAMAMDVCACDAHYFLQKKFWCLVGLCDLFCGVHV